MGLRHSTILFLFFVCTPLWGQDQPCVYQKLSQGLAASGETPKTISSKVDQHGNIVLFRVIDGVYQRGHIGDYAKVQGGDSYSFDPFAVQQWGNFLQLDPAHVRTFHLQVLIVNENVATDNLKYPSLSKITQLAKDKEDIRPLAMGRKVYRKLTTSTSLSDFALMSEVKVPTGSEKIIAILDFQTFSAELSKITPDQFDLYSFLSKLNVTVPNQ